MSKTWIKELYGTEKPVIGMCHFDALPGDPRYDPKIGLNWVIDRAVANLEALQSGGVDAVMLSNEFSLPYLTEVEPITPIVMARIIGEIKRELRVPMGVNVLWDPQATVELAVAVEASFAREVFSGVYASDFGLWNTNFGSVKRSLNRLGGEELRLIFNIYPEASVYLGDRSIEDIAKSTVFNNQADVLCVSGITAGAETSIDILERVVRSVPDTPVFANTGVNLQNVKENLELLDGVIVGTAFKKDGDFFEVVDESRVRAFMDAAVAGR